MYRRSKASEFSGSDGTGEDDDDDDDDEDDEVAGALDTRSGSHWNFGLMVSNGFRF